jgi:hypothetical protein
MRCGRLHLIVQPTDEAVVLKRRITWSCGIGTEQCHSDQAGHDDQTGCDIRFEPSIECAAVFGGHGPVVSSNVALTHGSSPILPMEAWVNTR